MESLVLQKEKGVCSDSPYIEIARKHRSTPWRVYHLGHGGRGKTLKDMRILEELQQYGIISHIYPW